MPDEAKALEAGAPEAETPEAGAPGAEAPEDVVLVDEDKPGVPSGAATAREGGEMEPDGGFQATTSEMMSKENRTWMGETPVHKGGQELEHECRPQSQAQGSRQTRGTKGQRPRGLPLVSQGC